MSYDPITPARVWSGFWRWLSVGVLALAVLGGVIYAGSQFGWWLSGQAVNHQTQQIQNSDSNQRALVNAQGVPYAQYWEGFVDSVSGPATWDAATGSIKVTGAPTMPNCKTANAGTKQAVTTCTKS